MTKPTEDQILHIAAQILDIDEIDKRFNVSFAKHELVTFVNVILACFNTSEYEHKTDEEILKYADDLEVLKGYSANKNTKWIFSRDSTGYDDWEEVDGTEEVLALARFGTTLKENHTPK